MAERERMRKQATEKDGEMESKRLKGRNKSEGRKYMYMMYVNGVTERQMKDSKRQSERERERAREKQRVRDLKANKLPNR